MFHRHKYIYIYFYIFNCIFVLLFNQLYYIIFRSATKEEKDKENIKKIAPVTNSMPPAGRPSSVQARPISGILQEDFNTVC